MKATAVAVFAAAYDMVLHGDHPITLDRAIMWHVRQIRGAGVMGYAVLSVASEGEIFGPAHLTRLREKYLASRGTYTLQ
jgi:hypothetical protein